MQIVGVAGMSGSGRSVLARALAANRRWTAISLSGLLLEEAHRRGVPGTPQEIAQISQEWSSAEGDDALIHHAIREFSTNAVPGRRRGLVVYNVRRIAEVDAIHKLVGRQIWIETSPVVRAARLGITNVDSVRMVPEELSGVSFRSDVFCENNGDDIQRFRTSAGRILNDDKCCAVEFD